MILFTTINADCFISCYENVIEGLWRGGGGETHYSQSLHLLVFLNLSNATGKHKFLPMLTMTHDKYQPV